MAGWWFRTRNYPSHRWPRPILRTAWSRTDISCRTGRSPVPPAPPVASPPTHSPWPEWGYRLYGGLVLSPDWTTAMSTPITEQYGLGTFTVGDGPQGPPMHS